MPSGRSTASDPIPPPPPLPPEPRLRPAVAASWAGAAQPPDPFEWRPRTGPWGATAEDDDRVHAAATAGVDCARRRAGAEGGRGCGEGRLRAAGAADSRAAAAAPPSDRRPRPCPRSHPAPAPASRPQHLNSASAQQQRGLAPSPLAAAIEKQRRPGGHAAAVWESRAREAWRRGPARSLLLSQRRRPSAGAEARRARCGSGPSNFWAVELAATGPRRCSVRAAGP